MMEVNKNKAGEIKSIKSQKQSSLGLLGFKVFVLFILYLIPIILFYTRSEYTPLYKTAVVVDTFAAITLFYIVIVFPISLLMFSKSRLISNISTLILSWFGFISSHTLFVMYENYCAKKDYLIELGHFSLRRFVRFDEKYICMTKYFEANSFPINEDFIRECAKHCKTVSACKESVLEYILFCKEKEIAASVTSWTQFFIFAGVGFVAGAAFFLFPGSGGLAVPQTQSFAIHMGVDIKPIMDFLLLGFKGQNALFRKLFKDIDDHFDVVSYDMDNIRLMVSGFEHLLHTHWSPIL